MDAYEAFPDGGSIGSLHDLKRYRGSDIGSRDLEGDRAASEQEWKSWTHGEPEGIHVRQRPEALRFFLEAEARERGHSLTDLLATVRPGRLDAIGKARHDVLALLVLDLRTKDVDEVVIAQVLGCDRTTVTRLAKRGRFVAEQARHDAEARKVPCRRHPEWRADCPACLRNAPDESAKEVVRHYPGPRPTEEKTRK